MCVGPLDKMAGHQYDCRCTICDRYKKSSMESRFLSNQLLEAGRKKDWGEAEKIAIRMEELHSEQFQLRYN